MRNRRIFPVCLAAVLAASSALPVYGAVGPGQAEKPLPEGITAEQWNRLNDQDIEFDELYNLVRYFNPDLQNTIDSININVDNAEYIQDEMRGYIKDLEDDADQFKDSGGINMPGGAEMYGGMLAQIKGYKASADKTQRTIKKLKQSNSKVNYGITQASKQYEYYADQIMIGYNSAVANKALLQKVAELSNAAYEAQNLGQKIGTATQTDVLSAKKEVLSAQSSLLSLDHTIEGLQRSLGLMTGYSADSIPQIGGLPELDMQALSSLDLEADTAKAIGNNYSLIDMRRTNSDKTTTGMKNKQDSVSEGEQGVAVSMQAFYQDVKQAKTAYDAACTAYDKASLDKGKAERSFQMGMLSKINYLQSQMAFLQAEGGKQSAYTTLYQAYDTYQWAVQGIISDSAQ